MEECQIAYDNRHLQKIEKDSCTHNIYNELQGAWLKELLNHVKRPMSLEL